MGKTFRGFALPMLILTTWAATAASRTAVDARFFGEWQLVRERSSDIDPWRNLQLSIVRTGDLLVLRRHFRAGRYSGVDSIVASLSGKEQTFPLVPGKWLEQPHLAVYVPEGAEGTAQLRPSGEPREFYLDLRYDLQTVQGSHRIDITYRFRISTDGQTLWITELRSTRPTPLSFVFQRVP